MQKRKPSGLHRVLFSPDGKLAGLGDRLYEWLQSGQPLQRAHPSPPPAADTAEKPGRFVTGSYRGVTGRRPYKLYIPAALPAHPPLLVMLHGCLQNADDFAAGTRMNHLAARSGFLVLYPEQILGANLQRCWNWFDAAAQSRAGGEPALLAGLIGSVAESYRADRRRIFAAGLSAGGAQVAALAHLYPALFARVGIHSGLAFGAAHDANAAFAAMREGRPGDGETSVPAIIFQGDRDATVNPRNADYLAAQFGANGAADVQEGVSTGGLAYRRSLYRGLLGRTRVESWQVQGLGHAWSGGSTAGSFTEPAGPDASGEMVRFFLNG